MKWGLQYLAFVAGCVKAALTLLDAMSGAAETSMMSIAGGHPNPALAFQVMTDRTNLGIALMRTLGRMDGFDRVTNALGLYARSLAPADPASNLPSGPEAVAAMRAAQQGLRSAILAVMSNRLAWVLFRHDKGATA